MYDEQRGSDLIQLAAFINRERKPLEYFQELRISNYFFYATNPSSPAEGKQRFKAFNYSKKFKNTKPVIFKKEKQEGDQQDEVFQRQ